MILKLIFKFQDLYLSTTSLAWIQWHAYVRSIIEKFTITQMPTCQQFKYPVKVQTNSSKPLWNAKLIKTYKLKVSILFPWCSRDIFSTIKPKLTVQCKCNTNIKYTINQCFLNVYCSDSWKWPFRHISSFSTTSLRPILLLSPHLNRTISFLSVAVSPEEMPESFK